MQIFISIDRQSPWKLEKVATLANHTEYSRSYPAGLTINDSKDQHKNYEESHSPHNSNCNALSYGPAQGGRLRSSNMSTSYRKWT